MRNDTKSRRVLKGKDLPTSRQSQNSVSQSSETTHPSKHIKFQGWLTTHTTHLWVLWCPLGCILPLLWQQRPVRLASGGIGQLNPWSYQQEHMSRPLFFLYLSKTCFNSHFDWFLNSFLHKSRLWRSWQVQGRPHLELVWREGRQERGWQEGTLFH